MDVRLRELERRAAIGDPNAQLVYDRNKQRICEPLSKDLLNSLILINAVAAKLRSTNEDDLDITSFFSALWSVICTVLTKRI